MRAAIIRLIQDGQLEYIPRDDRAKERGVLGKRFFRFIREAERVNVTGRLDDRYDPERLYTPELIQDILARDQLLFEIFAEYQPPDWTQD